MPPKEKTPKAMVTKTAFEMTREYGFAEVTARKLADRLGCSTQPIFRAYENMYELRTDIFYMSSEFFYEHILSKKSRSKPSYLTVSLAYIELARQERHLFELIASVDDFGTQTVQEFIKNDEWKAIIEKLPGMEDKTTEAKNEVFMMLWMFVHGLASLIVSNRVSYTEREIKSLLTKAYEGFCSQS